MPATERLAVVCKQDGHWAVDTDQPGWEDEWHQACEWLNGCPPGHDQYYVRLPVKKASDYPRGQWVRDPDGGGFGVAG